MAEHPTPTTPTTRSARRAAVRARVYPETAIDDFSRVDSAVEFYLRVNALVAPEHVVVDYGAGRAAWFHDGRSRTRNSLRMLKGKVAEVVGVDVDPVVAENPTVDRVEVIEFTGPLPFDDASVDVVVSDYTFEHIDDPAHVAAELERVLRPGGWVCARTPNKRGYIGLSARLVPNHWHATWLRRLQPSRREVDVFPVRYNLNTPRDLQRWFPTDRWEHVVYTTVGEPAYAGSSTLLWAVVGAVLRWQPQAVQPLLLIFLRKR